VQAYDLQGNAVEVEGEDLFSRAMQHEIDHLSGRLFIDLIEPAAKTSAEAKLREFETQFRQAQTSGVYPDDAAIVRALDEMKTIPQPTPPEGPPAS
jgi:peptide deformylase